MQYDGYAVHSSGDNLVWGDEKNKSGSKYECPHGDQAVGNQPLF
jgi:hypothetical protein